MVSVFGLQIKGDVRYYLEFGSDVPYVAPDESIASTIPKSYPNAYRVNVEATTGMSVVGPGVTTPSFSAMDASMVISMDPEIMSPDVVTGVYDLLADLKAPLESIKITCVTEQKDAKQENPVENEHLIIEYKKVSSPTFDLIEGALVIRVLQADSLKLTSSTYKDGLKGKTKLYSFNHNN